MPLYYYGSLYSSGPTIVSTDFRNTGLVWYVDSAHGSNSNSGLNEQAPFLTLAQAISGSVASNGDIIVLLPGFAETITVGKAFSKAGVTVVGAGVGGEKARIIQKVSGVGITMSGVGVEFYNIAFPASVTQGETTSTNKVSVTAAGCGLYDCDFYGGGNDTDWLVSVAAAHSRISGCTFTASARGASGAIVYTTGGDYGHLDDVAINGGPTGWTNAAVLKMNTASVGNYRWSGLTLSNVSNAAVALNSEKGIIYNATIGQGCLLG